jgi:retron-type reverse transcriptase
MKRAGNLIEHVADAVNLRLAFWKASKGKRAKAEVLRFRADLDARLRALREQLLSGSVAWGPYRRFMVFDPKERTICAAPFRDRVAHHAILNVIEPHFESYQIADSYACRKGKGLDAALARAVGFSRPGDWYLKMDVRKYFDSVEQGVLKMLLRRRFKDRTLLGLLDGVIDSHESSPGRGLPIGNLTSQFFANHYLGLLDHHVKQTLRCRRYARYMDDFVVWDCEKDRLRQVKDDIAGFLRSSLHLEIKPVCLNACSRGLTFLGYRVFPGRVRLASRSRKRFRRRLAVYSTA